jgi:hypothetical protein
VSFRANWTAQAHQQFENLQAQAEIARAAGGSAGKKRKASKQEGLFKQVSKAIGFLLENPRHPSLNTHEFTSLEHPFDKGGKVFEAYAQNKTPGAYRIFWCYGPQQQEITIIAITPHP